MLRFRCGEVEALFDPIDLASFAADYWLKRPLRIPGTAAKLERLFGHVPTLDDLLRLARRATAPPALISAFFQNPRAAELMNADQDLPRMNATPDQVGTLLGAGATVALYRVDSCEPSIANWTGLLRKRLQHAGGVGCSIWISSPKRGMYAHFDTFSSLHIQLVGQKTWRISREPHVIAPVSAGVVLPDGTADADATGLDPRFVPVDRAAFEEVTLRPGDVFFVPSGVWHETAANAGEISASCSFEFRQIGFRHLLAEFFEEHFAADPHWRAMPLAPLGLRSAEQAAAVFMSARLDEAIAALTRLREERSGLAKAWKKRIAENGVAETRRIGSPPQPAAVAPDDRLAPPPGKPLTATQAVAPSGADVVYLYQENQVICFDEAPMLSFGLGLAAVDSFRAEDACRWSRGEPYPWEKVRELLETLVGNGILQLEKAD